jgi:hypothetical protein
MAFLRPDLPGILTRANWDKKKSVIAKVQGKTGIGEQMDRLKAAYAKVDWEKLAMRDPGSRGFSFALWDEMRDAAVAEVKGNLRRVVEESLKLRDTAEATEKKFAKNKTIPKTDIKLAGDIKTAADRFGVSLNMNSVGPEINDAYTTVKAKWEKYIGDLIPQAKGAVTRAAKVVKEMRADPTAEFFNANIVKASRDISQQVVNMEKFSAKGFQFAIDMSTMSKLNKQLVQWSNTQGLFFKEGVDENTVKKEIDKFQNVAKGYWDLLKKAG